MKAVWNICVIISLCDALGHSVCWKAFSRGWKKQAVVVKYQAHLAFAWGAVPVWPIFSADGSWVMDHANDECPTHTNWATGSLFATPHHTHMEKDSSSRILTNWILCH